MYEFENKDGVKKASTKYTLFYIKEDILSGLKPRCFLILRQIQPYIFPKFKHFPSQYTIFYKTLVYKKRVLGW